jgi:cell division protein FtsL
MAADKNSTSLRKRAQITKANRVMFMWVAGASVIVSVSAVVALMMFQKSVHNQKAISKLNETVKILKANNDSVPGLQDKLRALGSDESLLALRSNDTDNALRVILDALPAEPNPAALGASMQSKLFGNITVESVQVTPLGDAQVVAEEAETTDVTGDAQSIAFQFSVKGPAPQLKDLLSRLERSIRTIQIKSLKLESSGGEQTLTVEGEAYYLPAKTLQLKDTEVKR